MMDFRQRCGVKATNITEEDSALVQAIEEQATAEKWTGLASTTVCFLSLLFQQHYQVGLAVPGLSERLAEARKCIGALPPRSPWNEAPYSDVQRRIYDVISVLDSCNLIFTAATPTSLGHTREAERTQRKCVRFNYDIFVDPRIFLSTCSVEPKWDDNTYQEECLGATEVQTCSSGSPALRRPAPMTNGEHPVFPPSACLEMVPAISSSPDTARARITNDTTRRDLFSPLGRRLPEKNEWYDDSLKQLGLYHALPEDSIDWKPSTQFKENCSDAWGSQRPIVNFAAPSPLAVVDSVEIASGDDMFPAVITSDHSSITTSFLC
ncbi:unnamed protein product [Phytophthora fragariaefolia]|uniref:Unnamed protein product n=1 Tax=Phytophthora fragariaefolia TaxID=1490495 RepID=A0A9W6WSK1_9STRA|nr:unnamed protein product [Phytophthora fragariaefolia]